MGADAASPLARTAPAQRGLSLSPRRLQGELALPLRAAIPDEDARTVAHESALSQAGEPRLLVGQIHQAALDRGASEQPVTFALSLARRDGRWEVAELLPAPPLSEEVDR